MKLRIKSGDTVKVIAGKDKGKSGKVIQVFPAMQRVVVEGVNMTKRHLRSRRQGEKGQVIEVSMPVNASNVQILGDDGKARRHGVHRRLNPSSAKKTKE